MAISLPHRRTIIALVALLAGTGLVSWFWSDARSGSHPIVELRVNLRRHVVLNQGAPLQFDVTLAADPNAGVVVGSRWRPWHRQIHFELAGGAALPWPVEQPLPASSIAATWDPEEGLVVRDEARSVAALDGTRVDTVVFEASPAATAAAVPGKYELRAVLEAPFWMFWTWHGRIASAPVVIDVRPADAAFEMSRLASAAAYYLRRRRYEEARPLVEELVRRQPQRSGPQVLLGRLLEGLNDRQGAVDAYARALQLMPRTYEEPVELIERMGRLMTQGRSASETQAGPGTRER